MAPSLWLFFLLFLFFIIMVFFSYIYFFKLFLSKNKVELMVLKSDKKNWVW